MASHPHREKRLRQSKQRRERNVARKTTIKKLAKKLRATAAAGDQGSAQSQLPAATAAIAKAAKTGTLHKRAAARRISRLAKTVNAAKKA